MACLEPTSHAPSLLEQQPLASGIVLTAHARARCVERGVGPRELEGLLLEPFLCGPCRLPHRQWLVGPSLSPQGQRRWLAAVVEARAGRLVVVTVFRVRSTPSAGLPAPHLRLRARERLRQRSLARAGGDA